MAGILKANKRIIYILRPTKNNGIKPTANHNIKIALKFGQILSHQLWHRQNMTKIKVIPLKIYKDLLCSHFEKTSKCFSVSSGALGK